MNMLKVCNSTEFVNYVKPEVAMIEMEVEKSLLLTTSGGGLGFDTEDGGTTIGGGNNTGGGLSNRKPIVRR